MLSRGALKRSTNPYIETIVETSENNNNNNDNSKE